MTEREDYSSCEIINLVSFGNFEKGLLESVILHIENEFAVKCLQKEVHLDLGEFYDPSRRQYDGYRLLKLIDERFADIQAKTIGLMNVDLYIPILTFIFGQAYLNGKAAIASSYRLLNERYGLAANEQLLNERMIKEVTHELGHTFGLIHCSHPDCVMRSSTYVEDIDQKDSSFCMDCKSLLAQRK